MLASRSARRGAALVLLAGLIVLVGVSATAALRSFVEGQTEIADKQAQLRGLREMADARAAFEHLVPRKGKGAVILPAEGDADATLATAIAHAAEGQQVIVDGVDAMPSEPVASLATVHVRGTQAGLYAMLKALEDQVPYQVIRRLEVTPSRSADPDNHKPFILSADLRVATLVAPHVAARKAAPTGDAAP